MEHGTRRVICPSRFLLAVLAFILRLSRGLLFLLT